MHIPDWFLKRRVVRREDLPSDPQELKGLPLLSVAVTHTESGEHATCSIPAGSDFDAAQVLSRVVRGLWYRRLDDHEKRKVEKYLEERTVLAENAGSKESLTHGDNTIAKMEAMLADAKFADTKEAHSMFDLPPIPTEDSALTEAWTKLSKLQNDSNMDPRTKVDAMRKQSAKLEKAAKRRAAAKARHMGTSKRLSSLVVAEIRATIVASLSTLRPAVGDSFPSSKTNLILHSPAAEHEDSIDQCILTNAFELGSDVITLHAQDLAQLAGDYLGEGSEPSPRSIRSLGYETYRLSAELSAFEEPEQSAEDDTEFTQPPPMDPSALPRPFGIPIIAVSPALRAVVQNLKNMQFGAASQFDASNVVANDDPGPTQSQSELQLEDMKLMSLLEALVDASDAKQSRGLIGSGFSKKFQPPSESHKPSKSPAFFDYSMSSEGAGLELNSALPASAKPTISMALTAGSASSAPEVPGGSKIIYVKDFKELNATHYGGRIIQKLEELVRKRRSAGESIMIVGSTCSRELTPELTARYVTLIPLLHRGKLI